jgi:hypothetical protein
MKKLQATVAAAVLSAANAALAAGDSGTSSVGDLQMSGGDFAMLVGGLVGLGVVVWIVAKVVSK